MIGVLAGFSCSNIQRTKNTIHKVGRAADAKYRLRKAGMEHFWFVRVRRVITLGRTLYMSHASYLNEAARSQKCSLKALQASEACDHGRPQLPSQHDANRPPRRPSAHVPLKCLSVLHFIFSDYSTSDCPLARQQQKKVERKEAFNGL